MKRLATILCVFSSVIGASGQGTINFFNTSTTLVSYGGPASPATLTIGNPGTWYFALLTSPVGAGNFSFAGLYATNQTVAGHAAQDCNQGKGAGQQFWGCPGYPWRCRYTLPVG